MQKRPSNIYHIVEKFLGLRPRRRWQNQVDRNGGAGKAERGEKGDRDAGWPAEKKTPARAGREFRTDSFFLPAHGIRIDSLNSPNTVQP